MSDSSKGKFDLAISIITLLTSLIGFITAGFILFDQKNELDKQARSIEELKRSFQNINTLRESLRMPLEGIWAFQLTYTRYNELPANKVPGGAPYMKGKAGFLWQVSSGESYHYKGYFGAGIYQDGKGSDSIVTVFSENTIIADATGVPESNFKMNGEYIARTALAPAAKNPPKNFFDYTDCKTESGPTGKPNKILCKYRSDKSDADVVFTRQ